MEPWVFSRDPKNAAKTIEIREILSSVDLLSLLLALNIWMPLGPPTGFGVDANGLGPCWGLASHQAAKCKQC